MTRARRLRRYEGYLFILPWLIGLALFRLGPMLASLVLSFTQWDLMRPPVFVGLENYQRLLGDKLFWASLQGSWPYRLAPASASSSGRTPSSATRTSRRRTFRIKQGGMTCCDVRGGVP